MTRYYCCGTELLSIMSHFNIRYGQNRVAEFLVEHDAKHSKLKESGLFFIIHILYHISQIFHVKSSVKASC